MRSEDLEKYDYSPVMGEPENGFYPVPKGRGTYYWNGERIVPKERGDGGEGQDDRLARPGVCRHEGRSTLQGAEATPFWFEYCALCEGSDDE